MSELVIDLNGKRLTVGQATALWSAIQNFLWDLVDEDHRREIGEELARGYHDRLHELNEIILAGPAPVVEIRYTPMPAMPVIDCSCIMECVGPARLKIGYRCGRTGVPGTGQ